MEAHAIKDLIRVNGDNFTVQELRGITTDGNPENLQRAFLSSFLAWRTWHGFSSMVLSAYRPNDAPGKAHREGVAIDVLLWELWRKTEVDPYQQWLLATTWPFQGVGIYFDWEYNGNPVCGLHVDGLNNARRPLRWLRLTKRINGKFTKLYYYQNTKTGKFYNNHLKETITLKQAIKKYEEQSTGWTHDGN